uniref:Uncharacterized protein n=1 Tax=Anguilla anguilla TaxID=7936 RepID=A0A0E9UV89_ANGAN
MGFKSKERKRAGNGEKFY